MTPKLTPPPPLTGGYPPGTPIFDPLGTPFLLEFPYEMPKKGGQKPPKKGQKWSILGQKLTFSPGVPRETAKNTIFHREILMVFSLFAKIVGPAPPLFDPPGPPKWPIYHCFDRKMTQKWPKLPLFWQENDPQNDPPDPPDWPCIANLPLRKQKKRCDLTPRWVDFCTKSVTIFHCLNRKVAWFLIFRAKTASFFSV